MEILQNLEPFREHAQTILFDELAEVNWVIYFDEGTFDVGFEFNGEKRFPL